MTVEIALVLNIMRNVAFEMYLNILKSHSLVQTGKIANQFARYITIKRLWKSVLEMFVKKLSLKFLTLFVLFKSFDFTEIELSLLHDLKI